MKSSQPNDHLSTNVINTTQLEQTILNAARIELLLLKESSQSDEGQNDVGTAFITVTTLVMLGHIKNSGLSEGAVVELLAIETEAAQIVKNIGAIN